MQTRFTPAWAEDLVAGALRFALRGTMTEKAPPWAQHGEPESVRRKGDLIEVFGAIKDGDVIVRRGTDEIREGAKVNAQPAKTS